MEGGSNQQESIPVAESAGHGGRTTSEYSTIQSNFDKIVTSLTQEGVLNKVAVKVFEHNCIARERFSKCQKPEQATDFMLEILTRIEVDVQAFYVFVKALLLVPSLKSLSEVLRQKCQGTNSDSPSHRASDDVHGTTISTNPISQNSGSEMVCLRDITYSSKPASQTPQDSAGKIPFLPHFSACNGPSGIMPPVVPSSTSAEATHMDSLSVSEVVYRTPVPTDTKRKDHGGSALIVNGALEVQQELHNYQVRLNSLETEHRQLKEKVEERKTPQRIASLDLELCRNRKSYEFHQKIIIKFADELAQLQAENKEVKKAAKESEETAGVKMAELEQRVLRQSNQIVDDKMKELKEEIVLSRNKTDDLELAMEELRFKVHRLDAAGPTAQDESQQNNNKICPHCNIL